MDSSDTRLAPSRNVAGYEKERLQEGGWWRAGGDVNPERPPVGGGVDAAEVSTSEIRAGARVRDSKRCVEETERMTDVTVIGSGWKLTVAGQTVRGVVVRSKNGTEVAIVAAKVLPLERAATHQEGEEPGQRANRYTVRGGA